MCPHMEGHGEREQHVEEAMVQGQGTPPAMITDRGWVGDHLGSQDDPLPPSDTYSQHCHFPARNTCTDDGFEGFSCALLGINAKGQQRVGCQSWQAVLKSSRCISGIRDASKVISTTWPVCYFPYRSGCHTASPAGCV